MHRADYNVPMFFYITYTDNMSAAGGGGIDDEDQKFDREFSTAVRIHPTDVHTQATMEFMER